MDIFNISLNTFSIHVSLLPSGGKSIDTDYLNFTQAYEYRKFVADRCSICLLL